jgi:hypothetical protein
VIFTNAITGIVFSDRDYANIDSAMIGGSMLNIQMIDAAFIIAVTPGTVDLSGVSSGYPGSASPVG